MIGSNHPRVLRPIVWICFEKTTRDDTAEITWLIGTQTWDSDMCNDRRTARNFQRLAVFSRRHVAAPILFLVTAWFGEMPAAALELADLVLTGGKVVTLDASVASGDTLAIRGDRILAVGTIEELQNRIGGATRVIRVDNQMVIPGFIEGHGHFLGLGQSKMILDLSSARSWTEIVSQVAKAAERAKPDSWIVGRGWHQNKWNKPPVPSVEGNPTHTALSLRTPHHPVLLTHASGHMCIANQTAMTEAGLDRNTRAPAGGQIILDSTGAPTGVLRENAMGLVRRAYDRAQQERSIEDRERETLTAVRLASEECLRFGVTSFHDAGSSFATVDIYRRLADSGKLPVRLWVMLNESNERLSARIDEYSLTGYADHRLTVRGIKRLVDGALGSHGAWLLEPYSDLPSSSGLNTLALDDLRETARLAIKHRMQLCVHAIGDRANREVLNIYEQAFRQRGSPQNLRWRIEHAQHLDPADIPRFAQLGVIASMQTVHCTSDAPFVVERLGQRRAQQGAYAWRTLIDSGAIVSCGTDVPVERVNPLAGIYSAITRKTRKGKAFFPEQCMTRIEALRSYSILAAYSAFEENEKGTLTPGKLADVAVLDRDILACDVDDIPKASVTMTISGGKIVYSARSAPAAGSRGKQ